MTSPYYNADAYGIDAAESEESPYYNDNVKIPPLGLQVPSEEDHENTTLEIQNHNHQIKKKKMKNKSKLSPKKQSSRVSKEKTTNTDDDGPQKAVIPGLDGLSKLTEDYHHSRVNTCSIHSSTSTSINGQRHRGLFLDMANGRRWLQDNSKGKYVLNLFCYTCAFSVAALRGGAEEVVNIDKVKGVIKIGQRNHDLNNLLVGDDDDGGGGDGYSW